MSPISEGYLTLRVALIFLTFISLTAIASPPSLTNKTDNHYIVVFKDELFDQSSSISTSSAPVSKKSLSLILAFPKLVSRLAIAYKIQVTHTYLHALHGFAAEIPPHVVARLQEDPQVAFVEPDLVVQKFPNIPSKTVEPPTAGPTPTDPTNPSPPTVVDPPTAGPPAPPSPYNTQFIPFGIQRMKALNNPTANIDGKDDRVDVDVAVIDSGVDPSHPDLNVVQSVNFSTDDDSNDLDGHGTHVAGTIGALDNQIGVVGMAPGARIWSVKVLDKEGKGRISGIAKGIDYVTEHADKIGVANMSLGSVGISRTLHKAIKNSVNAGVFYAVAAGNETQDVYGEDGVYGTPDDIIPASYPEVAAVSAMCDTDGKPGGQGPLSRNMELDDTLASFSNYSTNVIGQHPVTSKGASIDLAAPGVQILSTTKGGAYATFSGSSMASPHIAGLAALYIAQYGRARSRYGVDRIRQTLIDFSESQRLWNRENSTFDPDGHPEGLGDAEAIGRLGSP